MLYQLIIGLVLSIIFWLNSGLQAGLSSLFGMFAGLSIAAYLGYGVFRANRVASTDPKRSMMILYFGAVQRFVLVIGLFIVGLAVLKLEPLAMALTFGVAQFAYAINLKHQGKVP